MIFTFYFLRNSHTVGLNTAVNFPTFFFPTVTEMTTKIQILPLPPPPSAPSRSEIISEKLLHLKIGSRYLVEHFSQKEQKDTIRIVKPNT